MPHCDDPACQACDPEPATDLCRGCGVPINATPTVESSPIPFIQIHKHSLYCKTCEGHLKFLARRFRARPFKVPIARPCRTAPDHGAAFLCAALEELERRR